MNIFTKLCRLCTSHVAVSLTLNSWDSDNVTFLNKLNETVPGILDELDNELPIGICETCIVRLNDACSFRKKCFQSREILKQLLVRFQNGEIIEESSLQRKVNEIILTKKNCDKFNIGSNLINRGNFDDYHNFESFEFINVNQLQNHKFLQENNECKIEENAIKLEENVPFIKEEQIDENNDSQSNEFNSETDTNTIIRKENNELSKDGTGIKNEIFFTNNTKTNDISVEKSFSCGICEETFDNKIDLKLHDQKHKSDNGYNCTVCNKFFKYKSAFLHHIRTHSNTRPHKCDSCGKAFVQSTNLMSHIRLHMNDKPFVCETCGKGFIRNEDLKRHLRTHSNDRPFKCDLCEKAFKVIEHLRIHMITHTNEKGYKCEICNKTFTQNGTLKRHIRSHTNDERYICEICGESFTQNGSLKKHVSRIHSNEKPFVCEICNRAFSDRTNLTKHIRVHTKKRL